MTKSETFTLNVYADVGHTATGEYLLNININELKKYNKFQMIVKDFYLVSTVAENTVLNSTVVSLQSNTFNILNNYETPTPTEVIPIYNASIQRSRNAAYNASLHAAQQAAYDASILATRNAAYNNAIGLGQTVAQANAAADAAALLPGSIANAQTQFNNAGTNATNIAVATAAANAAETSPATITQAQIDVADYIRSTPLKNSAILTTIPIKMPYVTGQTNIFRIMNPNGRHNFYLRNFEGAAIISDFFFTLVIIASQE